jgi:hypothetical protein
MIDAAIRSAVRQRANYACEYCYLAEAHSPLASLQIEHIIPRKHRGDDGLENLALACIDCNLAKGSNLAGIDPETGALTPLYHPRRQKWDEHFTWNCLRIVGHTAVGRTTIDVLRMNSEDQLQLRNSLQ